MQCFQLLSQDAIYEIVKTESEFKMRTLNTFFFKDFSIFLWEWETDFLVSTCKFYAFKNIPANFMDLQMEVYSELCQKMINFNLNKNG